MCKLRKTPSTELYSKDPRNANVIVIGVRGSASKTRFFDNKDFALNLVPNYALLLQTEKGVFIFDYYDNKKEHADRINLLLGRGWKKRSDFSLTN